MGSQEHTPADATQASAVTQLPAVNTGVVVARTGLQFTETPSFEEWQDVGRQVQEAAHSAMWWLGDWWVIGSDLYGETAAQAVELGFSPHTLMNAAVVCRAIPPSRRRDGLTFSHHSEVASLPEPVQDEMLERAELESWSTRDLRKAVKALAVPEEGDKPSEELCARCPYREPPVTEGERHEET